MSDAFTYGIHYYLQTMGSRSSVPTTQNRPQPFPGASMNSIYTGPPGIISAHLVGSMSASCSSCQIPSNDVSLLCIFTGLIILDIFQAPFLLV